MAKFKYLIDSVFNSFVSKKNACPSCGAVESTIVDRKYVVTLLRRCSHCKLLFRAPTTSSDDNRRFYQKDYTQGFTTDCPSNNELEQLIASNFENSPKNYDEYIALAKLLGAVPGNKVYDFGCSWGYGSYQLAKAGFDVESYEISEPRARYATEKLGVRCLEPSKASSSHYDVFFSAHVIEHVPSVSAMISTGVELLKPGGLFLCFTPNASADRRDKTPDEWHQMWGEVHPQVLDIEFLNSLQDIGSILATSSPYDMERVKRWDFERKANWGLDGSELMFAFRKKATVTK